MARQNPCVRMSREESDFLTSPGLETVAVPIAAKGAPRGFVASRAVLTASVILASGVRLRVAAETRLVKYVSVKGLSVGMVALSLWSRSLHGTPTRTLLLPDNLWDGSDLSH